MRLPALIPTAEDRLGPLYQPSSGGPPRYLARPLKRKLHAIRPTQSEPTLRLVPAHRPLFTCQRCQSATLFFAECPWCRWTSPSARAAFEAAAAQVVRRRASAPRLTGSVPTSAASSVLPAGRPSWTSAEEPERRSRPVLSFAWGKHRRALCSAGAPTALAPPVKLRKAPPKAIVVPRAIPTPLRLKTDGRHASATAACPPSPQRTPRSPTRAGSPVPSLPPFTPDAFETFAMPSAGSTRSLQLDSPPASTKRRPEPITLEHAASKRACPSSSPPSPRSPASPKTPTGHSPRPLYHAIRPQLAELQGVPVTVHLPTPSPSPPAPLLPAPHLLAVPTPPDAPADVCGVRRSTSSRSLLRTKARSASVSTATLAPGRCARAWTPSPCGGEPPARRAPPPPLPALQILPAPGTGGSCSGHFELRAALARTGAGAVPPPSPCSESSQSGASAASAPGLVFPVVGLDELVLSEESDEDEGDDAPADVWEGAKGAVRRFRRSVGRRLRRRGSVSRLREKLFGGSPP